MNTLTQRLEGEKKRIAGLKAVAQDHFKLFAYELHEFEEVQQQVKKSGMVSFIDITFPPETESVIK